MFTIILASILISLVFAPLGCLAIWKKYVYFGDGLAHASLLAGTISMVAAVPIDYSGSLIAVLFAVAIFKLKSTSDSNAAISLTSNLMLSLSIMLAYLSSSPSNINNLLFGDILAVSNNDVIALSLLLLIIICFIKLLYNKIILIILNRDIARIQGIKVEAIELAFLILLSLSVFLTIKIVGALLITSILLTPAMAARLVSSTPSKMIIIAAIIALASNLVGLSASFYLDMPIAPMVVVTNAIIYFVCYINCRTKNLKSSS